MPGRGENRVYVRRRGRMTAGQARALERLSGNYLLRLRSSGTDADFLADAFGRRAPLVIEVGFGNGAALAALALAHPQWNCVGVDVYQPGFGALLLACERHNIRNVRIADSDALAFLHLLPPSSIRRLHVFFPDPWPKKRHRKRRLVNDVFAARAADCLEPEGRLLLATDCGDYAEAMQDVLSAEPLLLGGIAARPSVRPVTPFEAKATAQGRVIVELDYRRTA